LIRKFFFLITGFFVKTQINSFPKENQNAVRGKGFPSLGGSAKYAFLFLSSFLYSELIYGQVALNFDGSDDFVTTPVDADLDAMATTTWEAWVYPTASSGSWRFVMSMEDGGWDRFIANYNNKFTVGRSGGQWDAASLTLNKWQHVAVIVGQT